LDREKSLIGATLSDKWYRKASAQTALVSAVALVVITLLVEFSPRSALKEKVATLETQLAPFRALALERFGGNEQQALAKLAAQLGELEAQLKREGGVIRRFDVAAFATLKGKWKSSTPPDFSHLFKTGARAYDIRVELKTNDADMRWLEFTDSSAPRMAAGENNSWILDYAAQAPAGSWILGVNRNDLQRCGNVEMRLYGIDKDATTDSVITVTSLTLSFYINGVPACRCEYHPDFTAQLSEEQGSPVRIQLGGPVSIQTP
jgi:hypothetical protein